MSFNLIYRFLSILKIGATPSTFAYPIPLASFVAFSLSGSGVENFIISFVFCFLFITSINLWNHLNDLEDDIKAGRSCAAFIADNKKAVFSVVVIFYTLSTLWIVLFTKDLAVLSVYLVCAFLTWIYSDKFLVGKRIKRLKEWYVTELLTYLIVSPSFFIVLWSFFSPLSEKGFAFSLVLSIFYLSGMFLKDIKDASADLSSGYRTLAVIYEPVFLLKLSIFLNIIGIFLILILSLFGTFPLICAFSSSTLIILVYVVKTLRQTNWSLSEDIINVLRLHPLTYIVTLSLLGALGAISSL
ncbi:MULTISPECIES: UbiA family prenyltransferase [unclassified Archaeoglobus]|mgnify:CR=1 FL=1|jgi:1,4-dihydroxy-2-naphthoate octaprenyltransferase|uniref:UbiA family prenyltransferase n=1 Tax=unclassified Archaeoglobus TaxID=2643606 RepID=UPI0025BC040C|nr:MULTISPECIES: UbiA family prenyltransferase [unclassified Archaeoglobus]